MFRRRLRPQWSPAELAALYEVPHDHRRYGFGHLLRVEHTITLGRWAVNDLGLHTGADLSCGNGEILSKLRLAEKHFGDFAPGWEFTGPIEDTLPLIPPVDIFICSETIEHLDQPETVLAMIRERAGHLLLSTPIGEDDLGNPEHLHGWDQEAVTKMLAATGWGDVVAHVDLFTPGHGYSYQIFCCR